MLKLVKDTLLLDLLCFVVLTLLTGKIICRFSSTTMIMSFGRLSPRVIYAYCEGRRQNSFEAYITIYSQKVAKNYRPLNILFCDFNSNEFNRLSACDTTKEVYDTLGSTYEGSRLVRQSKTVSMSINMRSSMLTREYIKDMYVHMFYGDNQKPQVLRENIHQ